MAQSYWGDLQPRGYLTKVPSELHSTTIRNQTNNNNLRAVKAIVVTFNPRCWYLCFNSSVVEVFVIREQMRRSRTQAMCGTTSGVAQTRYVCPGVLGACMC